MQMRAGRKGHKKNEHGPARDVLFFCALLLQKSFALEKIDQRRNRVQFKETGQRELLNIEKKFLVIQRHKNDFIWHN